MSLHRLIGGFLRRHWSSYAAAGVNEIALLFGTGAAALLVARTAAGTSAGGA